MAMPAAIWMSRSLSTTFSLPYVDESAVRLFCITFQPHDKVLLFPPSCQTAKLLRNVIETHWGLDSHETAPDCYTLNLTGSPFLKHARRESALNVKYLCCAILDRFKEHGWDLIVCADLSCRTDLTAWYFARSAPRRAHSIGHRRANLDEDGSDTCSISSASDRRFSTAEFSAPSLVCLSLSKTRKLQLINAPLILQRVLKNVVQSTYAPGVNSDSQRGRHYEIKLNGSPWETTNREQLTAACRMIASIFAEFNARGYRFYGLVNFKETSDSVFFEYDPSLESRRSMTAGSGSDEDRADSVSGSERFMMVIMDGANVLRLVGVQRATAQVVEEALKAYWEGGLAGKPSLVDEQASANCGSDSDQEVRLRHGHHLEGVAVDFVLKGSPWLTRLAKIAKTRQLVARLLDVLVGEGWTVVTGLDMSRGLNAKSALLFQSCAPTAGLRHACISPLGKQNLQLVNGPASLRRLIQGEFQKIITNEKTLSDTQSEGGFLEAVFEVKLNGFHWDPHPEKDAVEYVNTRKYMGALLQRLMDTGWRVVVSADCGHHQEDQDVGEGIHSWFLIFAGSARDTHSLPPSSSARRSLDARGTEGAYGLMNVSSRMGRRASAYAATAPVDAERRVVNKGHINSPITRRHRR